MKTVKLLGQAVVTSYSLYEMKNKEFRNNTKLSSTIFIKIFWIWMRCGVEEV